MTAGIHLPGNGETIDLQQQVARLQALLEASRLVHSTIREEDVLEQVLHIVVHGLEMSGAALPGTGLAYCDAHSAGAAGSNGTSPRNYPLDDRNG
jgi:nitrate/nitrite-specific signal transduction histidine kinase